MFSEQPGTTGSSRAIASERRRTCPLCKRRCSLWARLSRLSFPPGGLTSGIVDFHRGDRNAADILKRLRKPIEVQMDEAEALKVIEGVLHGRPIVLDLDPLAAFTLLGHIQLALRHPGNVGPSTKIVRDLGRRIQVALAELDPQMDAICERGWYSVFDVERLPRGGTGAERKH